MILKTPSCPASSKILPFVTRESRVPFKFLFPLIKEFKNCLTRKLEHNFISFKEIVTLSSCLEEENGEEREENHVT